MSKSNFSLLTQNSELKTQERHWLQQGEPQRSGSSGLLLLIGLPGSGKSTLAQQLLAECPQRQLISTDAIRGKLFGNEAFQGSWLLIWREIQQQLQQALTVSGTTIYDATNAQRRHRREVIALGREVGYNHITGIWVKTPVWVCLARNKRRDRQVPEDIIFRMHRQLRDAPPSLEEGLDQLICFSCKSSQVRELHLCNEQEPHLNLFTIC